MSRFTALLTLVVIGLLSAVELISKDPPARYRNPIVFCRTQLDEQTGRVLASSKLWVMEEDGSGLRQLTHGPTREDHPSFYSDRRHILYAEHPAKRPEGDISSKLIKLEIYTGEREVLMETSKRCNLSHPSLSPLGELPAYHLNCVNPTRNSQWVGVGDDRYEVNTVCHNGVALPDGIIFMHEKNRGYSPREVSIARMFGHGAGAKMVFLTDDKHLHRRPAVSPDGEFFTWQTNVAGGEDEIFLADIDGSHARNLTNAPGNDGHPWFSQDGKKIVFESDRTGVWEIWILEIDSGKATQLTFSGKKHSNTRARM